MDNFHENSMLVNGIKSLIIEGFKDQTEYDGITCSQGLRNLHQFIIDERTTQIDLDEIAKENDDSSILKTIMAELKPEYKITAERYITILKKKAATSEQIIDGLIEAYQKAKTEIRAGFIPAIKDIIKVALNDKTEAPNYHETGTPMSTYGANLRHLYEIVREERKNGKNDDFLVDRITTVLKEPYKTHSENAIKLYKAADATSKDIIDGLLEAYSK